MISAPSHIKKIVAGGKSLTQARRVLIMLHGRGATAESILSFASHLKTDDFALLAPQATNNTWYPYSFLAAPAENEPWLSSALSWLSEMVSDLISRQLNPGIRYPECFPVWRYCGLYRRIDWRPDLYRKLFREF